MEVLHYSRWSERDRQIEEAAKSGLASVHQMLHLVAEHHDSKYLHPEGSAAASSAIANFRRVTMLLSRTGHARFRRGPRGHTSSLAGFEHAFTECPNTLHAAAAAAAASSSSNPADLAAAAAGFVSPQELAFLHQRHQNAALAAAIHRKVEAAAAQQRQRFQQQQHQQQQHQELALGKQVLGLHHHHHHHVVDNNNINNSNNTTINSMNSMSSRSFVSSLSIDPNQVAAMQSSGSPLSNRRKCMGKHEEPGAKCATLKCHCSKRRKLRVKRTIKVPAISNKLADIPQDEYSWRKYGQKPIKGSPHPRGYYKCSSMRGCPARKHVERSLDDPSMLIVTYEGEHNHTRSNNPATTTTTTTNNLNNNNNNNNSGTPAPPAAGGAGAQASGGGLVAHS